MRDWLVNITIYIAFTRMPRYIHSIWWLDGCIGDYMKLNILMEKYVKLKLLTYIVWLTLFTLFTVTLMYTTTIMTLVTHTTINISIRVHRRSLVGFMFRNLCFLCNDLSAIIFSPVRPLLFLPFGHCIFCPINDGFWLCFDIF